MKFFTGIFERFWILLRNTYAKVYLWVAASVYFNREASQESIYFLGKYYSWRYLNVKIPHSKLSQEDYLFHGGSTYLLEKKFWGSSYFPKNNYLEALF